MCGLGGKPEPRGLPCPRDGASLGRVLQGKGFFLLPTSFSLKKKTNNTSFLRHRVQSPRHEALAEVCVGQPQLSNKPRGGRGTQLDISGIYLGCIAMEMVSLVVCLGWFSLREKAAGRSA